jgi:hypothetical protein
MPHITRVAKWESLSNGQVAYILRVDNDPTSDFTMTLDVSVASDPVQLPIKLTAGRVQAEALYDASLASEAAGMTKVGQAI